MPHDSFDSSAGRAEDCRLLARPSLGRWFNSGSKECPFGSGTHPAAPLPFGPAHLPHLQGPHSLQLLPLLEEDEASKAVVVNPGQGMVAPEHHQGLSGVTTSSKGIWWLGQWEPGGCETQALVAGEAGSGLCAWEGRGPQSKAMGWGISSSGRALA